MKKNMMATGLALAFLTSTFGLLKADPTFSSSSSKSGPSFNQQHPQEGTKLRPRLTGVFVAATHDGFELLNPLAPREYGNGERFAAQPTRPLVPTTNIDGGPGGLSQSGPNATRTTGGIKVFGFEF